jgi:predicted transposase YbfD/YdcC
VAEQVRAAEKSDEITAIAELLNFFRIQGCIVIIDAMGCQNTITREIIKSQACAATGPWKTSCMGCWMWGSGKMPGRCAKDNAPANFACLRRMALTQLKQETTKKLGLQGKRRREGWDQAYSETVLNEIFI